MDNQLIKRAYKKIESLKDFSHQPLGSFFCLGNDNTWYDYPSQGCYGGLHDQRHGCKIFVDIEWERHKKPRLKELEYIDHWVNRSWAANAFITKDAEFIWNNAAIMDSNYPSQYVLSAGQGLRSLTEAKYVIDEWRYFKNIAGEDAAVILAGLFQKRSDYYAQFALISHNWRQGNFGKNVYTKILNKALDFTTEKLVPMNRSLNYSGLIRIWGYDKYYKDIPLYYPQQKLLVSKSGFIENKRNGYKLDEINSVVIDFLNTNFKTELKHVA